MLLKYLLDYTIKLPYNGSITTDLRFEMKKSDISVRRYLGLAVRIAVFIALTAFVIWKYKALTGIDVREIVANSGSTLVAVLSIWGVYLVKAFVFVVPASVIYTAVGMAFPIGWAVLINAVGIVLEVMATYIFGRILGGDYVVKLLSKKKGGQKVLKLRTKDKLSAVFGIRVLPIFPIDFVSLFLGASYMKPVQYLAVSFFGLMPRVALFTVLGDKLYDYFPMKLIMQVVLIVVPIALLIWIIRYAFNMKREAQVRAKRRFSPLSVSHCGVILDTDIGPDCDDAGAIALLATLADKYKLPVLGIVNCSSNRFGNGAIRAISEFCSLKTEIAQYEDSGLFPDENLYNKHITEKYLEGREDALDAHSALKFYKEKLKQAQDNSVVIITIGFLNNIARLIEECPELVEKKVNAIVSMAGKAPAGKEFNITSDIKSAKTVFEKFPNTIVCSGFEVGEKVLTGYVDEPSNASTNPIYDSYRLYVKSKDKRHLRPSWDLTAVQFAFEGAGEFYKVSPPCKITVEDDGTTAFVHERSSNRYYLINKAKKNAIADYLNSLLHSFDSQ